MATILFYEKPGCINNTRQKWLLGAAGHQVIAYNLLTEAWTPSRLQSFLGRHPVDAWFNRSAPQIKSGEIVPEQVDAQTALQLMVANPLLIRRPLIQIDDRYDIGFEVTVIDEWIGLTPRHDRDRETVTHLTQHDLQTCPHTQP